MKSHRIARPRHWLRTMRTPAILFAASLIGLVLALTGGGATDAIAALLLAIPVLAIARAWERGSSSKNIET